MKYLDENGLLYFVQKIKTWLNGKVDVVSGKGLSTNDFDNTYKGAIDNLSTNYVAKEAGKGLSTNDFDNTYKSAVDGLATTYVAIESGKGLSTNDYDNTEKAKVAAAQTAANVATIVEAYGYQTSTQVSNAINAAIGQMTGITFTVVADVSSLPATGTAGTFYLVPNSGSGTNTYDEYVWVTIPGGQGESDVTRYEKIGTTDIDLSGYVLSSSLNAITNAEIDTIIANSSNNS